MDEDFPPHLAFAITMFVISGFLLIAVLNVITTEPGPAVLALCLGCSVGLFCLQGLHSSPGSRARRLRERYGMWTLGAQALLTFVPLFWLRITWGGMGGFLAGSCLLIITTSLRWVLYGLIVAGVVGIALATGTGWVDTSYLAVSTVLTGLVVFATARLASLVAEVHQARDELAELAVSRERLRIARDLHDLLGLGLSAITLKSELTLRLVGQRPQRAREELEAILQISRQALADVRAVVGSYRSMSLQVEATSAEEILAAAEIEPRITLDMGAVPPRTGTVLAVVIREGVTNVLRHSKARHCTISCTELPGGDDGMLRLTIANDGVDGPGQDGGIDGGSGLGNLRARVARIGGKMTAEPEDDGWFRLTVDVPRSAGTAPDADPGPQLSQPFS